MHHFNWSSVVSSLPTLWTGAIITFKITLLALVFGILWGTVLALLRLSGIKPLEWFANHQPVSIVIDSSGLILTIGYLIQEAELVDIAAADGRASAV